MPGARPVAPAAGLRPPVQGTSVRADGPVQPTQQKSGAPVLEDSFLKHTDNGEQNILNSKPQEATTAGKKVFSLPLWFFSLHGSICDCEGSIDVFLFTSTRIPYPPESL